MKYIAAGNVMTDIIEFPDGSKSEMHIGGPAFFALSGIKLWTDEVELLTNVGLDFESEYGKWLDDNSISRKSISIGSDHTTHHMLSYNEDGSYGFKSIYGLENMGILKVTPQQILEHTKGTKGVYLAQNTDSIFWRGLSKARETNGFKFMWEIEAPWCTNGNLQRIKDCCKMGADAFSINGNEASILFDIPKENHEDLINEIMKLDVDYTWFRVGSKGAYSVTKTNAYFLPSIDIGEVIDPTGCGNSSTGTAMYAFCEGFDPITIGAMANITAAYNVLQYGPYPHVTKEIRIQAQKHMNDYIANLKK